MIVNQIPGNTLVSNMGQPGGTNIIVVPQSSTVRIEPQIVNQVLTPVNVVQNNPAAVTMTLFILYLFLNRNKLSYRCILIIIQASSVFIGNFE